MNVKNWFFLSLLITLSTAVTAATAPTDAEIARIVTTTNNGEIEMAKLAKDKAKDKKVKEFAQMMMHEHSKNNKKSAQVVKKLNEQPKESEMSTQLQADAKQEMSELEKLSGAEFDKAYIEKQVMMHEKVLANLDTNLIPNAKDKNLKEMLEKTRTEVAKHLGHAQKIQSSLK